MIPRRQVDADPPGDGPAVYAERAARAYAAMQSRFCKTDGRYRRDGLPRRPAAAAHLWPFARAFVATLDLAGVDPELTSSFDPELTPSFDADAAIAQRLDALERYWDPAGDAPAYSADILRPRSVGDRYYDDNAWVGLALVQLERMRPGAGRLERAAELFRFARAGWDHRADVPSPGGVFWVEQGRATGRRNHDRNTVSNAPNAELGLHLAELGVPLGGFGEPAGMAPSPERPIDPQHMYEWVNATLDADRHGDPPATGLFWDKLRGDGTIDRMLWSYNQGSMIGANVLLARRHRGAPQTRYLTRAETIARKALPHLEGEYERQPPAFNAIFFRNLLLLHHATGDSGLRTQLLGAMRGYVDRAWDQRRDQRDRFHFPRSGLTLLGQSAMVQLLALLAWDPSDYGKLA